MEHLHIGPYRPFTPNKEEYDIVIRRIEQKFNEEIEYDKSLSKLRPIIIKFSHERHDIYPETQLMKKLTDISLIYFISIVFDFPKVIGELEVLPGDKLRHCIIEAFRDDYRETFSKVVNNVYRKWIEEKEVY